MVTTADIGNAQTFKEAIDLYLQMTNMTYKELADQIGYSSAHTYGVCKGTYKITIDFLHKLSEITQLPKVFLMTLWLNSYDPDY